MQQEDREFKLSQRVLGIKRDKKNRFQLITLVMTSGGIGAIANTRKQKLVGDSRFSCYALFT
jgi:hypothetical protein